MTKKALPVISVKKAYFAKRKTTATTTPFYDPTTYLENVTEVGYEKTYNNTPFYAEGELKCSNSVLSEIPLTVALGDLTQTNECLIMGHSLSKKGGVIRTSNDIPPEGAFLFIEETADHKFEVTTLYSGEFTPGGRTSATSEGSANYQVKTITASFKPTDVGAIEGIIDNSELFDTLREAIEYCANVTLPEVKEEELSVKSSDEVKEVKTIKSK